MVAELPSGLMVAEVKFTGAGLNAGMTLNVEPVRLAPVTWMLEDVTALELLTKYCGRQKGWQDQE
jgi:hypothetical protein